VLAAIRATSWKMKKEMKRIRVMVRKAWRKKSPVK